MTDYTLFTFQELVDRDEASGGYLCDVRDRAFKQLRMKITDDCTKYVSEEDVFDWIENNQDQFPLFTISGELMMYVNNKLIVSPDELNYLMRASEKIQIYIDVCKGFIQRKDLKRAAEYWSKIYSLYEYKGDNEAERMDCTLKLHKAMHWFTDEEVYKITDYIKQEYYKEHGWA